MTLSPKQQYGASSWLFITFLMFLFLGFFSLGMYFVSGNFKTRVDGAVLTASAEIRKFSNDGKELMVKKPVNPIPPKRTPSPLPPNGEVKGQHVRVDGQSYAPFKLSGNQSGEHCLFIVYDAEGSKPLFSVFVRAGESVETFAPVGEYQGKAVCGKVWYGNELFGTETSVNNATQKLRFFQNETGGFTGMNLNLNATKKELSNEH